MPGATMRMRALVLVPIAAVVLAGCGGTAGDSGSVSGSSSGSDISGTLTVFAAASLTDVFGKLGDQLKAEHPGLDIRFNFAGSSALATQLTQGAPADVFASANQQQMAVVTDAGLQDGDPRVFAENVLQIAVPPGNPGQVTGLADFGK